MDVFPDARFEAFTDEADWLAARQQGVGSSDAPALLGVSPHRGAYEVFCEKIGVALPPPDPDSADLMAWGRSLEGPILEQFEARSDFQVFRPPRWHSYQATDCSWLRATLDAIAFRPDRPDPGPAEIKWAPFADADEVQERRPDYTVQNLHQQLALKAGWGIVVVLARHALVWFDVQPDPAFFEQYAEFTRRFWVQVLRKEAPAPDGTASTKRALAARFTAPQPGFITALPQEALLWDRELQRAKAEVKKWEEMAATYEARLKDAIGDAEAGVLDDGTVYTWRLQQRVIAAKEAQLQQFRQLRRKAGPLDLSALVESLKPDDGAA